MRAGVEQAGRSVNQVVVAVTGEHRDPVGVDRVAGHAAGCQPLADLAVAPLARQQGRQRHRQIPFPGRRQQVRGVPAGGGVRGRQRRGGTAKPGEEGEVRGDLHVHDLAEEPGQHRLRGPVRRCGDRQRDRADVLMEVLDVLLEVEPEGLMRQRPGSDRADHRVVHGGGPVRSPALAQPGRLGQPGWRAHASHPIIRAKLSPMIPSSLACGIGSVPSRSACEFTDSSLARSATGSYRNP